MLNSYSQEFSDLKSFALELKFEIRKNYGIELTTGSKFALFDEAGHRILSKCYLFLN